MCRVVVVRRKSLDGPIRCAGPCFVLGPGQVLQRIHCEGDIGGTGRRIVQHDDVAYPGCDDVQRGKAWYSVINVDLASQASPIAACDHSAKHWRAKRRGLRGQGKMAMACCSIAVD